MASTASKKIELHIPSQRGYEQIAADASAAVAHIMGFAPERIEDLKTAMREACRNAIEHAHHMNTGIPVGITFTVESCALHIEVEDQGEGLREAPALPNLRAMMEEGQPTRGWGLFLIRRLMDELTFEHKPGGGHVVHMILRLPACEHEDAYASKAVGGRPSAQR